MKSCKWNSDNLIKCSKCGERPAHNKSRLLCTRCYAASKNSASIIPRIPVRKNIYGSQLSNLRNVTQPTATKLQHIAEIVFAQYHPDYIFQPAIFRLGQTRYAPDFYDPIQNQFYEVIGSRQRFNQLKQKILFFREVFPNIKLSLVCADGQPYHSTKHQDVVGNGEGLFA